MTIGTVLFTGDILMSCFLFVRIIEGLNIDIWSATNCRIFVIVRYLPLYLGVNSIVLVAVERFVAIVLPMRFRAFVAPGMVKLQLTFVWLLTFVELIFPAYVVKVSFYLLWVSTGRLRYIRRLAFIVSQCYALRIHIKNLRMS